MSEIILIEGLSEILKAKKDDTLVEVGGFRRHTPQGKVYFGQFKKKESQPEPVPVKRERKVKKDDAEV